MANTNPPPKGKQFSGTDQPSDNSKAGRKSKTILNEILETEMGEEYIPKTRRQAICLKQVKAAEDGGLASFREVLDRTEGKVDDNLTVKMDGQDEFAKQLNERMESK